MRAARLGFVLFATVSIACGGATKKTPVDAAPEGGHAGGGGSSGGAGSAAGTSGGAGAVGPAGGGGDAMDAAADVSLDTIAERPDSAVEAPDADAGAEVAPPASGSPMRALSVSTGSLHTCALLDNHRIKCWGQNPYGELGLGDTRDRGARASDLGDALPYVDLGTGRTATAVSAGRYHTCAILDDGSVKCWGIAAWTGLPVNAAVGNVGDAPGEMGDHLPALVFEPGRKAKLIASSFASSCAFFDDDSAWCWSEDPPFVPKKETLDPHAPAVQLAPAHYGATALYADGAISPNLPGGRNPLTYERAIYVAGSETTGCAVLADGTAVCGLNSFAPNTVVVTGLLALGLIGHGSASCGLFGGGVVRCWRGCEGPSTSPADWCGPKQADGSSTVVLGGPAVSLTTNGGDHMCALLGDGTVKCWRPQLFCTSGNVSVACPVPAQDAQDPNLGSSLEIVTTNGVRRYGAWRALDLGKHP